MMVVSVRECVCVPAVCCGTTWILIMGPMVVGCVSVKLRIWNRLSLATPTKLSFNSLKAGESVEETSITTHNIYSIYNL